MKRSNYNRQGKCKDKDDEKDQQTMQTPQIIKKKLGRTHKNRTDKNLDYKNRRALGYMRNKVVRDRTELKMVSVKGNGRVG